MTGPRKSEAGDDWAEAMREIEAGGDVEQVCEKVRRRQTERVRDMIREEGREDLVAELDANLRAVHLGLTGARSVWHSISEAQRRVLRTMADGYTLVPCSYNRNRYWGYSPVGMDALGEICGNATVRALHARSLVQPRAVNVFAYSLTEHARFVLKHGPIPSATPGGAGQ